MNAFRWLPATCSHRQTAPAPIFTCGTWCFKVNPGLGSKKSCQLEIKSRWQIVHFILGDVGAFSDWEYGRITTPCKKMEGNRPSIICAGIMVERLRHTPLSSIRHFVGCRCSQIVPRWRFACGDEIAIKRPLAALRATRETSRRAGLRGYREFLPFLNWFSMIGSLMNASVLNSTLPMRFAQVSCLRCVQDRSRICAFDPTKR